jgi:hypothetical protein
MVKEMIRINTVFTLEESLYFLLNPIFIFLTLFALLQTGISSLFCQWWLKRQRHAAVTIFSGHTVLLLGGSMFALIVFVAFLMQIGMFYFDAYKRLFV